MKYKVILEFSKEGVSASVPCLPGCHSQGETEQEALQNISDAIHDYLAVVEEMTKNKVVKEVEILESPIA
jgi:predicted RNase H-like HicB family nuclease